MRCTAFGVFLLIAFGVSACSIPSPALIDAPSGIAEVEGVRFRVAYSQHRAEAIRLTPQDHRIPLSTSLRRGMVAITQVTGCEIQPQTLYGDSNLIEAYLNCPDSK
ncbi:MAG: hypothetical protein ACPGVJ_04195, partial [Mangrovicoccus sp.]